MTLMLHVRKDEATSFDTTHGHTRPATQHDIDNLQRVSQAFAYLKSTINASIIMAMNNAEKIIAGEPLESMTDREMEVYMKVEDYRQELMGERPSKQSTVEGFTMLDQTGGYCS